MSFKKITYSKFNQVFSLCLFLLFIASTNLTSAQYSLSEKQVKDGLQYLIQTVGFKDPSSVKCDSYRVSNFAYDKACFTNCLYRVRGKNGFGGYVSDEFQVWFFEGEAFYSRNTSSWFPPTTANGALDYILLEYFGDKNAKVCPDKEKPKKISQDKNEYPKIDVLINQNKFKEANEKLKNLNYPFDYPKRNLITQWLENENKRSNEKNIKTIDSLLNKNNLEEAIYTYRKLTTRNDSIKEVLQTSIVKKYSFDSEVADSTKVREFIRNENNKAILSTLTERKIEIIVNQDNSIEGLNGLKLDVQTLVPNKKNYLGFTAPIRTVYSISIDTINSKVKDSEYLVVNTNKTVFQKRNGKFYIANILNIPLINPYEVEFYTPQKLEEKLKKTEPSINREQLTPKKGCYLITSTVESTVKANNETIGKVYKTEIVEEGKLTKRVPKMILRSLVGVALIGVSVLISQ
jgi:hypothetical protein